MMTSESNVEGFQIPIYVHECRYRLYCVFEYNFTIYMAEISHETTKILNYNEVCIRKAYPQRTDRGALIFEKQGPIEYSMDVPKYTPEALVEEVIKFSQKPFVLSGIIREDD